MDEVVLKAAVRWWRAKRPANYNVTEHIKHPTVGCTTVEERELAQAVSEHERVRMVRLLQAAEVLRQQRASAG